MSSVELVDGAIPFSEFARVMASKETPYSCKDVLRAFHHFQGTETPNGHITPERVKKALIEHANVSKAEATKLTLQLDMHDTFDYRQYATVLMKQQTL